jgi:monoamine oxidase
MTHTRRQFLDRLGATAGAAMTYEAMTAIGLVPAPARAEAFSLQGRGDGTRVVILGAGLAGMSAGYELMKLGYDVRILEARMRPGGRCHTIRRGTASEEEGSTEVCAFDEGLYYNPGPMRIPHHHTATLGYCRELGVAVEVFVNDNESAFLYQTGAGTLAGKRLRGREVKADLSGYTAELLAKAASTPALDETMTIDDRDALLAYLSRAGALTSSKYTGTPRRGYAVAPGVESAGSPSVPLPLGDLLGANAGQYVLTEYLQQAPMFQVVGGTDRLAAGFASKLKDRVTYGAKVQELRQSEDGVDVVYMMRGQPHRVMARYAICAMPLNSLASLAVADVAPELMKQVSSVRFASSGKIGLQFKRRFWEEDDQIFGGISRTDQDITQIVYPSSGYLGPKGVLVGYYQSGARAEATAARPHEERQAMALAQGTLLHPQYADEFENGFSVSWQNVRYNKGAWAQMSGDVRKTLSPMLLEGDRRVFFAGDHCSYLTAWMAGALESGRYAAKALHVRAGQSVNQSAAVA